MHRLDLASVLALVAGIGSLAADAAFKTEVNTLLGAHGSQILAAVGVAGTVASQLIRVFSVPAGSTSA